MKNKLTEQNISTIEAALNKGKGTFEVVLKRENGELVVILKESVKVNTVR